MKKLLFLAALFAPLAALAQSPPSPALYYGFVPTPAQWNGYFTAKQDTLAYTPVNRAGDTMTGKLNTLTPSTSTAGLNLPPGVAPTSPVNGDVWTTSAGMYVQINGSTIGPFGGGGGITALTGDITGSGSGSVATTLATVNSNVGSFGDATHSPSFTVNGKGLITAASTNVIAPPFTAITGSLACSQTPALTGDATTSAGACATAVVKIQGRAVISTAPTDGQVLTWVAANSDWEPNSAPAGNVPVGGTTGQLLAKIDATNFNTHWITAAGTGTVTSAAMTGVSGILNVGGSPITTSGTFALSLATQSANAVFAGPITGSASAPTFRALVGADLPNPSASTLGGVESITSLANNWIAYIDTSGVPHQSQPSFTNLSGSLASGQLPGLASTNLWVGNGGGAATAVVISGDATMTNAGVLTVTKTSGSAFGTFATQNYATPPAIGGTTPAAGSFSTLNAGNLVAPDTTLTVMGNTAATVAPSIATMIHAVQADGAFGGAMFDSFGNAFGNIISGRAAGGTLASKTALASGEDIINLRGYSWDGSAYNVNADIRLLTGEAQTGSAHGAFIRIRTTPNGSTTLTSAMFIQASGGISVGTAADPGVGGFADIGVSIFGGPIKVAFRTVTAAGAVTVSATADYFVCVDKTSGAATTANLPAAQAGLTFLIKDCKGDAATNNITVTPASGTVDGAATYVMNVNFQSVAVTSDGTNWFVN